MKILLTIVLTMIGGALFRLRGDAIVARVLGWESATTIGRLIWALPTGFFMGLLTSSWRVGAFAALAAYAGTILGWGSYMDLGRGKAIDNERLGYWLRPLAEAVGLKEGSFAYDFAGHTLMGQWAVAWLVAVILFGTGNWMAVLSLTAVGYMFGAIYWVSQFAPKSWPLRDIPLGEFLFGGMIWATIWLTL